VVWAHRFEKFLEIVFWLPCLALRIMLDDCDILLVKVARFFVIIGAASSDCDLPRASLPALLIALCTFLSASADGFGQHCPAAFGDRLLTAKNKCSPNGLLTRGMPSGDIKKLLGGVQLITVELMHQGMTYSNRTECGDDVSAGHPQELMVLLREAPNVIQRDLPNFCRQLFRSQWLLGRTYIPWKLLVKFSLRSFQLSIMFLGRWSSQALAKSAR
jgi:hypothetical protein